MKCKECEAAGQKSSLYPGLAMSTCMMGQEFYDEDGEYHNHDPNITTQSFRCSNGHEWSEKLRSKCYACEKKAVAT